ncbi:hypothetical protein [Streptomyces murinus]|uniref:hypothetical protein n=1 Tax=Streptomyces murinus TaxID=33900 RepID=UPI003F4642FD
MIGSAALTNRVDRLAARGLATREGVPGDRRWPAHRPDRGGPETGGPALNPAARKDCAPPVHPCG